MTTPAGFELGAGWDLVDVLEAPECLFATCIRRDSCYWRALDRVGAKDPPQMSEHPDPAPFDPVLLLGGKALLYSTYGGIAEYGFETHATKTSLFLPDECAVEMIWISPSERSLVYLLQSQTTAPTDKEVEAMMAASPTKTGQCHVAKQFSLMSWRRGSPESPKLVATFDSNVSSASIDWAAQKLFATLSCRVAVEVDLKTTALRRLDYCHPSNLAISPRGTLLLWDFANSPIQEICADGSKRTLVELGRFPSFSPDGSTMAFTRNPNEFLLCRIGGVVESIVSTPSSDEIIYDIPNWCQCGKHVAVNLIDSRCSPGRMQFLIAADIAERKIVVLEREQVPQSCGGRVWIPTSWFGREAK